KRGGELPPGFRLPTMRRHGLWAIALVVTSIAAFGCPELLRRHFDWPLNTDAFPPVVGPGDATRIFLPQAIESVKGYWRGKSRFTARLADEPQGKIYPLPCSTGLAEWSDSMLVPKGEEANHQRLWVRLELPADIPAAGKKLQCTVQLQVEYP